MDVGTGYMVNEQGRQDHVANTLPQPYYWFDGVNDRIRGTASSKLNFYGHTKMTLMVRFKAGPSAGLDTPYLFGWFADSSNSILIAYPFTSGNPFVRSEFAESSQSDDLVGIPRNTDVNVIVLTVDGSNYSAYHNGKFILTFAGEDMVNCQDVDGKAHWAESGGSYWEGSVYQSQIWNTVLTDTEIKEISSGASQYLSNIRARVKQRRLQMVRLLLIQCIGLRQTEQWTIHRSAKAVAAFFSGGEQLYDQNPRWERGSVGYTAKNIGSPTQFQN